MATPKISTQASTPTFPTGAAQCDRLLRVNDIRELTGWSENTARKFMRESGKLIQIHPTAAAYLFPAVRRGGAMPVVDWSAASWPKTKSSPKRK